MTSLAEYNNNPGNIRPPKGVKYEGQIGVDDNGFAVFENYEQGRAALLKELKHKIESQKLRTPDQLVDRWSPASGENPEDARANYKIFLANTLGLESTNQPFPKDSLDKLATAIEQFESGKAPKVEPVKAPEPEPVEAASEPDFQAKKAQIALDLMAAGAGAGAAKVLDVGKNVSETAKAIRAIPGALQSAGAVPPAAPPVAPTAGFGPRPMQPPAGGPAGPVGGPVAPTSPLRQAGGPGAYNYGKAFGLTDIEAARALDMTKNPGGANDLIRQRAEALQRIQQMGGGYVENPRFGGLMTAEPGVGGGPRASFVQGPQGMTQIPRATPIPATPLPPEGPGALSRAMGAVREGGQMLMRSPLTRGALGGVSAAEQGSNAYNRAGQGDPTGAAIAGAGAVGSTMAMVPNPLVAGIGAAIATASPLTLYLRDKIRSQAQLPPPSPRELKEAEMPAFVFPAP